MQEVKVRAPKKLRDKTHIFRYKYRSIKLTFYRYDPRRSDLSIKIREGTEYEEVIGVKRSWIYQYRKTAPACSQGPAYYDIAILELGK